MKWQQLIGWGIVIYAIVFLTWSILVIHDLAQGVLPQVVLLIVLIIVATIAARALRFRHWYDILPYSIAWAGMAAIFDLVCALPISGWALYADWHIWVGYMLLATVPLLAPMTRRSYVEAHIS